MRIQYAAREPEITDLVRFLLSAGARISGAGTAELTVCGGGRLRAGLAADLTVFDPNRARTVDSARFLSKGRATPFEGRPICGTFRFTYWKGSVAYLG